MVELQKSLEVDKNTLRSFWPQVPARLMIHIVRLILSLIAIMIVLKNYETSLKRFYLEKYTSNISFEIQLKKLNSKLRVEK